MQVSASYKDIFRIAAPIMLGSIAQTVLNVTDTAFLARVGEAELGGSAIGGVLYFIVVMIGIAFSTGAQILMSRRAGEGNKSSVGSLFDDTILLLCFITLILFSITHWLAPVLYTLILKDADVVHTSITFIYYRSFGILFTIPALAIRSLFISIGQTRLITYQSLLMAGLNILFDYTLIFGNFGFEPMGIKGAGIATASAETIGALYAFAWSFYKQKSMHLAIFRFISIKWESIRQIINISLPIVIQNIISMGAWFVFFVIIEKLGTHELAISNIIRACYMIMMTPVWGFASASNSMVSNLIGQQRHNDVYLLMKKIIIMSAAILFMPLMLLAIFPKLLLQLTASDPILIVDSLNSFYVVLIAAAVFSVSINLLSAVSGTGATRIALIIEITNIIIYFAYIIVVVLWFNASVEVVWMSEIIYWFSMGIWSYAYLIKGKWKLITA